LKIGNFLLAHPAVPQSFFSNTVVLICKHGKNGASGLVVNQPFPPNGVDDIFPALQKYMPDLTTKLILNRIYQGGPVGRNRMIHSLHSNKDISGAIQLTDGLFWGGNTEQILNMVKNPEDHFIKFYCGYCSWVPGQLEAELDRGYWFLASAAPNIIFNPPLFTEGQIEVETETEKYFTMLSCMGGEYATFDQVIDELTEDVEEELSKEEKDDDEDDED